VSSHGSFAFARTDPGIPLEMRAPYQISDGILWFGMIEQEEAEEKHSQLSVINTLPEGVSAFRVSAPQVRKASCFAELVTKDALPTVTMDHRSGPGIWVDRTTYWSYRLSANESAI
jgi:hypothetical protein